MSRSSRSLSVVSVLLGALAVPATVSAQPSPPIVHEGDIGAACGVAVLGISTVPLVLIGAVPAGRTIVVTTKAAGSGLVPSLVVDSTGVNVYGPDVTQTSPGSVAIFSTRSTAALGIAQVISLTYDNTTGLVQTVCTSASVFSGLQTTPGWLDQSGTTGTATASTSFAVSTAGATTQPNELLVGAFSTGNAGTFTLGAGLTPLTAACNLAGNCLRPFYRVLSASGTQTATATGTTPAAWSAAIGTFRGEDFPVELQSFGIE